MVLSRPAQRANASGRRGGVTTSGSFHGRSCAGDRWLSIVRGQRAGYGGTRTPARRTPHSPRASVLAVSEEARVRERGAASERVGGLRGGQRVGEGSQSSHCDSRSDRNSSTRVISKRWEENRPTRPKYAIAGPLYLVGAPPDCPPLQTTSEGTLGSRERACGRWRSGGRGGERAGRAAGSEQRGNASGGVRDRRRGAWRAPRCTPWRSCARRLAPGRDRTRWRRCSR